MMIFFYLQMELLKLMCERAQFNWLREKQALKGTKYFWTLRNTVTNPNVFQINMIWNKIYQKDCLLFELK